jgi:hypothetical protein
MDRDTAVQRINQDLGFRQSGWAREQNIITMLQESQRNLEHGKTLPKFLLAQDATLALAAGSHTVAYPPGFLRLSDDTRLRYYGTAASVNQSPTFLTEKKYIDAVQAYGVTVPDMNTTSIQTVPPGAPKIYVFRPNNIDFITIADIGYTIYLDYYKSGDLLNSNIENQWLKDPAGAEWLIGDAGFRIASSLRDKDGMAVFDAMRTSGRAACFGEILASEEQSGPYQMGRNL